MIIEGDPSDEQSSEEIVLGPGLKLDSIVAVAMGCKLNKVSPNDFRCGCPHSDHAIPKINTTVLRLYSYNTHEAENIIPHFGRLTLTSHEGIVHASFNGLVGSMGESIAHAICLAAVNAHKQKLIGDRLG